MPMKKNILFFLLLFSGLFAFSQTNLKIVDSHGSEIVNGTTFLISGVATSTDTVIPLLVKNFSSSAMQVRVKRTIMSIVSNSENYFCWNECFLPNQDNSGNLAISSSETVDDFTCHFNSNGNSGISNFLFQFINSDNTDTAWVYIKFDMSTEVPKVYANSNFISAPFPSPANTYVSYKYSIKASSKGYVSIHNILGEEVKRVEVLSSGTLKINTSDMIQGVYICNFVVDNKIIRSGRIVVNH